MLLVVLTTTHLEDADLFATTVSYNSSLYGSASNARGAHEDLFTVSNHQHFFKYDLAVDVCRYLFYFKFFANGYFVLLAASFYDRIHSEAPNNLDNPAQLDRKPGILRHIQKTCQFFHELSASGIRLFNLEGIFCYHHRVYGVISTLANNVSTTPFFRSFVAEDMQTVDRVIRSRLHSDVVLIRQVAEYIISAGGKRLRPVLTLLSGRVFGYGDAHLFELAAMIEFIHTATLLHDDVVDESDMRRGRETANALFGNAASVLVGDFLYTRAFQMMVTTQNMTILQVMAEATNIIAEGEVLQLLNIGNTEVGEEDYLQVIRYKTAKLFEAACRVGALIAGASENDVQAMADYGMHLGTAFQIIDDVLDYSGDAETIGKSLGDDLAEGKPTLPLIYTMRNGSPEQAELVRNAIENASRDLFPEVLGAVQSCGALNYARSEAVKAAEAAIAAIQDLPDSDAKKALTELARLSVDRNA